MTYQQRQVLNMMTESARLKRRAQKMCAHPLLVAGGTDSGCIEYLTCAFCQKDVTRQRHPAGTKVNDPWNWRYRLVRDSCWPFSREEKTESETGQFGIEED